jgi:enoyl-CoA hydratase
MTSEFVSIEQRDAVLIVHLDDGKANALSQPVIAAIDQAITDAEANPDIAALVLHGRPGVFSGGFDLGVMRGGDADEITALVADGGDLVRHLYGADVPVIAACTGHAIAAGALILLGCDLRIGAAGESNIGLPEVNIKMNLPRWAVSIGVERLSRRHMQRALAHGRLTDPATAADVGFLDEVVAPEAVLDRAVEAATELTGQMHLPSYAGIVKSLRSNVLDQMAAQIAHDRASSTPIVAT